MKEEKQQRAITTQSRVVDVAIGRASRKRWR